MSEQIEKTLTIDQLMSPKEICDAVCNFVNENLSGKKVIPEEEYNELLRVKQELEQIKFLKGLKK